MFAKSVGMLTAADFDRTRSTSPHTSVLRCWRWARQSGTSSWGVRCWKTRRVCSCLLLLGYIRASCLLLRTEELIISAITLIFTALLMPYMDVHITCMYATTTANIENKLYYYIVHIYHMFTACIYPFIVNKINILSIFSHNLKQQPSSSTLCVCIHHTLYVT